jgi:Tfp pilus assembly protein PilV
MEIVWTVIGVLGLAGILGLRGFLAHKNRKESDDAAAAILQHQEAWLRAHGGQWECGQEECTHMPRRKAE